MGEHAALMLLILLLIVVVVITVGSLIARLLLLTFLVLACWIRCVGLYVSLRIDKSTRRRVGRRSHLRVIGLASLSWVCRLIKLVGRMVSLGLVIKVSWVVGGCHLGVLLSHTWVNAGVRGWTITICVRVGGALASTFLPIGIVSTPMTIIRGSRGSLITLSHSNCFLLAVLVR